MPAVTAKELKSVELSPDKQNLVVTFATKYVGDLEVTLPAAEIEPLLQAFLCVNPPSQQSAPQPPSPQRALAPGSEKSPAAPAPASQVTVMVPKTWLVTADTSRQAVIIVFNHESDGRAGYALNTESGQKLADALSKNATAISQQAAAQPSQPPAGLKLPG